ncbi:MAG: hypothetical protein MUC93_09500 [Bacteroidales bacterium]|jgi:hypothetical protein|nr:hypothetical protein [Bacteroidales bacterium]
MMDWTKEEIKFLKTLDNPDKIQAYLDSIDYNPGYECRSPRWVIKKRTAHCFEGALFAAAALQFIGYKPLIVDMLAVNDDDHVIAVFKETGYWGAVAKSNFTSLRYREPVYRSVRELIMSYFDFFFNTDGYKSLRSYSRPFDLTFFESRNWATTDEDLEYIGDKIESLHHYPVASGKMISKLYKASDMMLMAGLLGSKPEGLFKPGK